MKSTGIVRQIDELGRVVIPIELRRVLNLETKDGVAIFVDNNRIILEKYIPDLEKEEIIKGLLSLMGKVSKEEADLIHRALKAL